MATMKSVQGAWNKGTPPAAGTINAGTDNGFPAGSNQGQGIGTLPGKIPVPFPMNGQAEYKGGQKAKAPEGFDNGLKSGFV